ncbi:YpmS family protein [Streptococcus sp. FT1-106]|uniref:YpmS family protein n=1 Tax=unclassified Streptococcus TaxID=2608887 RepID=UPI003BF5F3FA
MKQRIIGKKINIWKWLCLLILAINLAFVGVVASRIIQIREPEAENIATKTKGGIKIGTFSTTKEQLNKTVVSYLEDYQKKGMTYKLYATSSQILFEGTYTLLGYEVPLYVYFQPSRLENGAVQLKVTSFSVGTLPLPEEQVLKYIKSSYDLPKFVKIQPNQSTITINVQNLDNEEGIYLKAQTINLVNDDISFDIYKKSK